MEENRNEVKVDVELQWKEFKWSLELLRHNEDFTAGTDRDWFQLNPTDIVLLACEAMGKAGKAMKALPSRVVLGFDDISCHLQLHPRFFSRLLDVLLRTLSGDTASTPSTVVNRFLAGLLNLVTATQRQLRMYHLHIRRRLVRMQEQLSDVMNRHNPDGSATIRAFQEFFRNTKDLQHWQASGMDTGHSSLFHLLSAGMSECGATVGSVDNAQWQLYESVVYVSTTLSIDYPAAVELLADIGLRKYLGTLPQWLPGLAMEQVDSIFGSMLEIVVYIASQHTCLADARRDGASIGGSLVTADVQDSDTAAPVVTDGTITAAAGDSVGENGTPNGLSTEQGNSDAGVSSAAESSKEVAGVHAIASSLDQCARLLDHIVDATTGVVAKHFPDPGDRYPVQAALFELCYMMLASKDFTVSFAELTRFLQQQFEMLVIYATEGYLTQHPLPFLVKLLDFLMSSVENGREVDAVLTNDLPNAFGHVFGIRHSEVSSLVIEFVTLSLCSRHQNDLLKSGLDSILAAYRLIKTDIQKRGEQMRDVKRVEVVRIVHAILHDVLERVDEQCMSDSDFPLSDGDAQSPRCVYEWQPSILDAPSEVECTAGEENVTRMDVLAEMLHLACAMVARGENMVYLFKTIVPKLIQEVPSTMSVVRQAKLARFFGDRAPDLSLTIPWQGDRKSFLRELFSVATEYKRCTDLSVFHLCSIAIPRFAAGLSHVSALDDQDKLEVTTAILSAIKATFRASPGNMSGFVTHGFDLTANLVRPSAQAKDVLKLAGKIARIFVANSRTSAVMVARQCMAFLLETFPGEDESVRLVISTLFEASSLQHLRALHRLCRKEFADEWYTDARRLLYALVADRPPAMRDFLSVTEILVLLMDLCPTRPPHSTLSAAAGDDSSPTDWHGRHERRNRRLRVLTAGVMKDMLEKVPRGAAEEQHQRWKKEVATIGLYAIICPEVLERKLPASSAEDDTAQIRSEMATFPWHVFGNASSFATLQSFTVRLEHMQVPRYAALRSLLLSILHQYVERARECEDPQEWRRAMSDAVDALPQNVAIKAKLVECGYSASLWTELDRAVEPIVTVTTSGTLSHEENLRQNLLRCYEEYGSILQQLHVTHVEVDGDQVKVVDLFDDRLSLELLRGRRAVACRCIDQNLDKNVHENQATRKVSLLTREERLEVKCEEMAKKAEVSPKEFQVVLHTSLFHTARSCGGGIIGCYAPNGEHCERPLEIGLRADQALASIYHDGLEIENVELVFGEEGAIVYKAYSNGHPFDTSEVWVKFFEVLLSSEQTAVPALIVLPGCPNTQTWLVLNRLVEPATTGFHIHCSYDFTSEWRTYLDSRPERVRGGVDIVLALSFCRPARQGDRTLRRLASMQKDLAGLIFTDLMARLVDDEHYKQFRFLGRSLAQCVGGLIACKDETPEQVISRDFKYDVYRRKMMRDGNETIQEKDEIIDSLAQLVRQHTADYCASIGVASLFEASRGNFFDLKHYLYQMRSAKTPLIGAEALKSQTDAIHEALDNYTLLVGIDTLSAADQEELMRWIFVNEDRVWRYRGGRDRNETLHQFFHFLPHRREDVAAQPCYPGVVVLSLRSKRAADWRPDMFRVDDVVAYAIGEFLELDFGALGYEIVTAYVQPRFRGLKLAVRMYITASIESNCSYLTCDMLEGSLENVITSNPILVALQHSGLLRYAIQKRELSYEVVDQTGCKEQFEKIIVNAWYLRMCMRAHSAFGWAQHHPLTSASLLMMPTLALVTAYTGFQLLRRRS